MLTDAEHYILGALLRDPANYWRVSSRIGAEDFQGESARLFAAIAERVQAGKAADAVTMMDDFGTWVIDLATHSFSDAQLEAWADNVAQHSERRKLASAGQRIALCQSYGDAQAILGEVRPRQSMALKSIGRGLKDMIEAIQARAEATGDVTGTPTGLATLDALTGGWQEGNLVGIGGETSSGKTAFAVQAALAAGRTYYASLEMTTAELLERVVCNLCRIKGRWLRFPKEAPEGFLNPMHDRVAMLRALPLLIDDQPGLTAEQIGSRARQMHMTDPLKLVVIDHLNLVRRPRKNDAAELGSIVLTFKNLAKELRIPVLVLVQLNRGQKARNDRRPQLEDFRSSGEIEETLDTAVMVYRDEYHNPEGPLKGYAEFIIRKQRQGERNVTAWAKSMLSYLAFDPCEEPSTSSQAVSAPIPFQSQRRTSGRDRAAGAA